MKHNAFRIRMIILANALVPLALVAGAIFYTTLPKSVAIKRPLNTDAASSSIDSLIRRYLALVKLKNEEHVARMLTNKWYNLYDFRVEQAEKVSDLLNNNDYVERCNLVDFTSIKVVKPQELNTERLHFQDKPVELQTWWVNTLLDPNEEIAICGDDPGTQKFFICSRASNSFYILGGPFGKFHLKPHEYGAINETAKEVLKESRRMELYEVVSSAVKPGSQCNTIVVHHDYSLRLIREITDDLSLGNIKSAIKSDCEDAQGMFRCREANYGIRIEKDGNRYDFLLSFSCAWINVFKNDEPFSGCCISDNSATARRIRELLNSGTENR